MQNSISISGARGFKVTRGKNESVFQMLKRGLPSFRQSKEVNLYRVKNFPNYFRGLWRTGVARICNISHLCGEVSAFIIRRNGTVVDLGVISYRVVTTAGVNYLVDALQNSVEPENFKYHGFGTGTNAEAAGDTALQTELTTQYATDNTRPTGSQTEGASANIYRTVGTLSPDATVAITEHGVLSQAATGGGTLLDRSVFSAINLVSGDSLQVTYDLTIAAGS